MDKELEQSMFLYIDALEKTNQQILIALKNCVELLTEIRPLSPDPNKWQDMVQDMEKMVNCAEQVYAKKNFH